MSRHTGASSAPRRDFFEAPHPRPANSGGCAGPRRGAPTLPRRQRGTRPRLGGAHAESECTVLCRSGPAPASGALAPGRRRRKARRARKAAGRKQLRSGTTGSCLDPAFADAAHTPRRSGAQSGGLVGRAGCSQKQDRLARRGVHGGTSSSTPSRSTHEIPALTPTHTQRETRLVIPKAG